MSGLFLLHLFLRIHQMGIDIARSIYKFDLSSLNRMGLVCVRAKIRSTISGSRWEITRIIGSETDTLMEINMGLVKISQAKNKGFFNQSGRKKIQFKSSWSYLGSFYLNLYFKEVYKAWNQNELHIYILILIIFLFYLQPLKNLKH